MNGISLKTPAKINWFLQVTGRRQDGYHLLSMVNQRIGLYDELLVEPSDHLTLRIQGMEGVPSDASNIVLKAAELLQRYFQVEAGARITLTKRIPMGAGLAGGSANAAGTLLLLNRLWQTRAEKDTLKRLALRLGADVPYCLHQEPALVTGIGEHIEPLGAFAPCWLVLLKPKEDLATKDVFHAYSKSPGMLSSLVKPNLEETLHALMSGRFEDLGAHCINSLQPAAQRLAPSIGGLLAGLKVNGAAFAQMTGAGSTVFGVFTEKEKAREALRALEHTAHFSALVQGI